MTACTYEGTYPVTFTASDGSLTASETVVMTIAHRDCAIPTWNTDPVIVSQSGANITVTIGAAVDPDGTAITYGYLREYDCMNRNWTETWDSTLKRISVTHPYATSSSNYHYFLTYAQDADGSRSYQYVIFLYPGAPYTGYTLGKAIEGATLTTNVCGGGTLFNWGPN
jgi:hypothetical protein